jgi:hypothetical protein
MTEEIKTGTILMKEGTLLPEALQIESEPCVPGWRLVKNLTGYALDRKVHETGWTFFWLAGEIRTIAFGADEQSMVRRAIKRILAHPRSKPFNSLEITGVASQRFLGLPYVSVRAHSRHVQEALVLFSVERMQKSGETESTATRRKVGELTNTKELAPQGTNGQVGVATAQSP